MNKLSKAAAYGLLAGVPLSLTSCADEPPRQPVFAYSASGAEIAENNSELQVAELDGKRITIDLGSQMDDALQAAYDNSSHELTSKLKSEPRWIGGKAVKRYQFIESEHFDATRARPDCQIAHVSTRSMHPATKTDSSESELKATFSVAVDCLSIASRDIHVSYTTDGEKRRIQEAAVRCTNIFSEVVAYDIDEEKSIATTSAFFLNNPDEDLHTACPSFEWK